jgi:hypothetical protein
MDYTEFIAQLKQVVSADTSADPEGWTPQNPLWGHCAVASLLAQDEYGGDILRGSLEEIPKYAHLRSHFWNLLPDQTQFDFTAEQYLDLTFKDLHSESRTRERILTHPDTLRRYELLKERLNKVGQH